MQETLDGAMPEDSNQIYFRIFSYLNQTSLLCLSQYAFSFCCFLIERIPSKHNDDIIDIDDGSGDFFLQGFCWVTVGP